MLGVYLRRPLPEANAPSRSFRLDPAEGNTFVFGGREGSAAYIGSRRESRSHRRLQSLVLN